MQEIRDPTTDYMAAGADGEQVPMGVTASNWKSSTVLAYLTHLVEVIKNRIEPHFALGLRQHFLIIHEYAP